MSKRRFKKQFIFGVLVDTIEESYKMTSQVEK